MVDSVELIKKYFDLDSDKEEKFVQLSRLYRTLNAQVNVISRRDIDQLYLHHVLHSLSIVRAVPFMREDSILDLGTGGGFPGIPLAIFFPESHFTLIDGTGKKIKIVTEVVEALKLKNAKAIHSRAEDFEGSFTFVVTRAVAKIDSLIKWSVPLLSRKTNLVSSTSEGGLIALKGGNLTQELKLVKSTPLTYRIDQFFEEPCFFEKFVLFFSTKNLSSYGSAVKSK